MLILWVLMPGWIASSAWAADPNPEVAPIPQFDFDDPAKSFVIRLGFSGPGNVSLSSATVVFGRSRTNLGKPPLLLVELIDHSDTVVDGFNEWDPLDVEVFDPRLSRGDSPQGTRVSAFPFRPDLKAMNVTDLRSRQQLIEVDLVPVILAFCEDNPMEPECAVDLEIASFEATSEVPPDLLIGEPLEITLEKTISNNGPLGIMDAELTLTATATAGATISPGLSVIEEPELTLLEQREVEEVFTVECIGFSSHTFTIHNTIAPANPVFIDPDETNDTAQLELEIECVVPVAINIKPHSQPNSVNRGGTVPVAVLSTSAGEYGTPIDFDATSIDPSSVRFGPRDAVFEETGGATERHGRSHIEDSYELDDETRDGDLDAVLHFRASESGLMDVDTEACVKGKWLDDLGEPHTFFGCDSVRPVGQ